MPELANREQHESRIGSALFDVFGQERQRLARGGSFDAERHELQVRSVASGLLLPVFVDAANGLRVEQGWDMPADRLQFGAVNWSAARTGQLAAEIASTTSAALAVEEPNLDAIFSEERAERAAVTETTRAVTAGESLVALWAMAALMLLVTRRWETEKDGDVCDLCWSLDGAREVFWAARVPGGPPAHPWCRCWLSYQGIAA